MTAIVHRCINQHTTFEVPRFTYSKSMIGAKLKTGHVTLTVPITRYCVIQRLAFSIFYLHRKFGDSRFSRSGDDCGHVNRKWIR